MDRIIAVADPNADDVRALLQRHGFRPCPPFGPYTVNPYSVCMTLVLDSARQA